jgi:PIN domain nuclease of toxin-antitoxin system
VIVLDTHALVWWVSGSGRLSAPAKRAIGKALREGPLIASTISVLEIATAVRRGRLELEAPLGDWLADLGALPELRFEPVSVEIARLAGTYAEPAPGDPADRIILATAHNRGVELVSADGRLRAFPHAAVVW